MLALEVVVAIGIGLLIAALVAPRLRLPLPLVQIAIGVLLGFVPQLSDVQLPSEAVLLLFLPAILFYESLTVSLREIRRFVRVILINGTLLVVFTAFAVALVATAFGMPWAVALVLGAALAPTDATAVGTLAGALPRRQRTVLRAESLINDGTALVVYGLVVGVAVGSATLTPLSITWQLAVSYVGGVVIGVAVGFVGTLLRRIESPVASNVGTILTPFVAFLAAELIHASGVLAVVVCGLVMSRRGTRVGAPAARDQAISFWTLSTYILYGALFVLIGLEVQALVREFALDRLGFALLLGVVIWIVLVASRFAFIFVTTSIIRAMDRRPYQRTLRSPTRGLVLSGLAGYRGAVSLAAALAVPLVLEDGSPFPQRDLLIFVTAVVIVLTLIVQAPLLGPLIRWAHLPADDDEVDERRLAQVTASEAARDSIDGLAAQLGVEDDVRDEFRVEIEGHLRDVEAESTTDGGGARARRQDQYNSLRSAVMSVKRDAVLRLRDDGRIDDAVLRGIQQQLDLEELRLTGRDVE